MFKKGCVWLLGLLMLLLPQVGEAAGITDHPTVAVMPFVNKAPVDWQNFGDYAGPSAENVSENLVMSNRFDVVEREQLQAIIDEKSLQMTGLTEQDRERQAAKFAGADYLVLGSVTELSSDARSFEIDKHRLGEDYFEEKGEAVAAHVRRKVYARVSVRVVDVKTGRIVLYGHGDGVSSNTSYKLGIADTVVKFGAVGFSAHQCANAIDDAAYYALYGERGIFSIMDGKAQLLRK